ncbi:MAG: hypothetical protein A2270_09610 [Elusimicrobia bacterium RIFOXYA12_FULL_51_18]|nr:MAG: hypothetical protein A2270_09610 [Elusimicrobia bacterium RIFOXYA12_FULL_51_18]OGS32758.1 MAG: hypothetical protein A2218_11925 [Elusimicrobia bacterium RIFOXYA2_FULL_53_38]
MTGTDIIGQLRGRGLGVSVRAKENTVVLSLLRGSNPLIAREILYKALNGLETFFNVFIKGPPFCFMPDAWDHIVYRKKKGAAYARVPGCGTCRLKELCPGLERKSVFHKDLLPELLPVLSAPNELVIELTKKCNLKCRACFSGRAPEEQSFKTLSGILRQAKKMGVKNIRFTGGEPFLSGNLPPLLKKAKAMGFYTLVNTNALAAGKETLKNTARYIDNVLVSLQGYDEASEMEATGAKGLFFRKLSNIQILKDAGIKTFRLGTVISKRFLKDFPAYYRLAKRLKADIWELYRPIMPPRALADNGDFKLIPSDMARLSKLLLPLRCPPRVVIANPVPLCLVPAAERKHFLGAAFDDGHTRVVHDPRGFFKPSYYINENLGRTLKKAWGSPILKKINTPRHLPPRCVKCAHFLKCLGGSRFLAKEAGGGYSAGDPWLPK